MKQIDFVPEEIENVFDLGELNINTSNINISAASFQCALMLPNDEDWYQDNGYEFWFKNVTIFPLVVSSNKYLNPVLPTLTINDFGRVGNTILQTYDTVLL